MADGWEPGLARHPAHGQPGPASYGSSFEGDLSQAVAQQVAFTDGRAHPALRVRNRVSERISGNKTHAGPASPRMTFRPKFLPGTKLKSLISAWSQAEARQVSAWYQAENLDFSLVTN